MKSSIPVELLTAHVLRFIQVYYEGMIVRSIISVLPLFSLKMSATELTAWNMLRKNDCHCFSIHFYTENLTIDPSLLLFRLYRVTE